RAGHSDFSAAEIILCHRRACHETRSVPVAHRCAMGQERIAVREVGVSMNGNSGDLELPQQGTLVQCLDILELVNVFDVINVDLSRGKRVKHECVVRIRTVREVNYVGHPLFPRERRALTIALTMSSWCREYSGSFFATSVFSTSRSFVSYRRRAAPSSDRVAIRAARISP